MSYSSLQAIWSPRFLQPEIIWPLAALANGRLIWPYDALPAAMVAASRAQLSSALALSWLSVPNFFQRQNAAFATKCLVFWCLGSLATIFMHLFIFKIPAAAYQNDLYPFAHRSNFHLSSLWVVA